MATVKELDKLREKLNKLEEMYKFNYLSYVKKIQSIKNQL